MLIQDKLHAQIWLNKNELTLHMNKSVYMTFGISGNLKNTTNIKVLNGDSELKRVDEAKYLRVTLDSTSSFKVHIPYIQLKLIPRLKMLHKMHDIVRPRV